MNNETLLDTILRSYSPDDSVHDWADKIRAIIEALPVQPETQESAAYVDDEGFIIETGLSLSPGMKLYTHPAPANQDVDYKAKLESLLIGLEGGVALTNTPSEWLLKLGQEIATQAKAANQDLSLRSDAQAALIEAKNTILWLQRRLDKGYEAENIPHVNRCIAQIDAAIAGEKK